MSDDEGMKPNHVGWCDDSPFGVTIALSRDARTQFKHGTALSFSTAHVPAGHFALWFCPSPKRHVHALVGGHEPLSNVCAATVMAYTLSLAMDRHDWQTEYPGETTIAFAWEDVLKVLTSQNGEFGEFLRQAATERGALGSPRSWVEHYSRRDFNHDPEAN